MKISSRPLASLTAATMFACTTLHAEPPKIVESPTAATAGKATIAVTESNKVQTIEADGKDVGIEGNDNKITLDGACHALTVSGSNNLIIAEAVATVTTSGSHNKVTWTKAVDGEKPQVTDLGSDNKLAKRAE